MKSEARRVETMVWIQVGLLVAYIGGLMQQLLDDVGILLGEALAHLRAGVFRRDIATEDDQATERCGVELVEVRLRATHQLELLLGVVDQGAELANLLGREALTEELLDFALDVTRGVADDVLEGLVLTMQVGQEMLRRLRQVEDCLQVDDFGRHTRHGREVARKKFQVA